MITRHPAESRGRTDIDWLDSWHSFSFGDYHDPAMMGFRALRVINDDRVAAGQGFGTHAHRDMEILTYVLDGALAHKDSLGNGETLRPGEVQVMTAGRGIEHSEFNPSRTEPVHLYQIWLKPREKGLRPAYGQKAFEASGRSDTWQRVASGTPNGSGIGSNADGALTINTDADVLIASIAPGRESAYTLRAGRRAWVQALRGKVELNGVALAEGDGASVSDVANLNVRGIDQAEVMLFDLA